ncbi:MAG TPA: DUF4382 domain-containing protein [Candidatus Acidoferrum sp.]|nr:DUF4382 domain-containing protein [Candidatus Acidoferrum sp.]
MNPRKYLVFAVCAAVLSLSACSGLHNGCTTNCGGNGDALLSVSISDTPPTNTTILSFTLPITGIKLTSSTGTDVPVFSSTANFELTRLQSDSDIVVTNASVPAGNYTSLTVAFGSPKGVFINSSSSTVGTCVAGAVCPISGTFTNITVPVNITLNSDANQWLDLDFNYNNAIDTSAGIGINLQLANVLAVNTTSPAGIPAGDFANVDDFTGRVLATPTIAGGITVSSTVRGNLTAEINSSTQVFDPQGLCGATVNLSCIGAGSIVSVQGVLTNTGTVIATSLDVIDSSTTPADEVEGTIYPSNCNGGANFGMILSDSSISTNGSPLATSPFGTGVCLTVSPSANFVVDTGILFGQPGVPTTNTGFSTTNDLLAGQTVRAKVTSAASGTNGVNATASLMILRFSRLTGSFGAISGNGFTISGLPTYITAFATSPVTQTFTNATIFEGATGVGNLSGTVSISALFYNPVGGPQSGPLLAAKVRQH